MIFALGKRKDAYIDWHADIDGKGSRCLIAMDKKGATIVRLFDGVSGVDARFTGSADSVIERATEFIKRKTGVDVQIIAPVLTNHNGGSNDGA